MMKTVVDGSAFYKQIQTAARFLGGPGIGPSGVRAVLLNFTGNKLEIRSTNLGLFFLSSIERRGEIEVGPVLVESRNILDFLHLLPPGELEIEVGDRDLGITQGKTRGRFPRISAQDYPATPGHTEGQELLSWEEMERAARFVAYAAAKDGGRPVLGGVGVFCSPEGVEIAATDGFRLALFSKERVGETRSLIVPGEFLSEAVRLDGVAKSPLIYYEKEGLVGVVGSGTELFSRLVEGEYPPYKRVVPAEKKTTITVAREDFERATKTIAVFAREHSNIVLYDFTKDGVVVRPRAEAGEGNRTQIDGAVAGESQTVAFNHRFVLEYLQVGKTKNILIEVLRPDAPVVFRDEGEDDLLHIIMPVRVQE